MGSLFGGQSTALVIDASNVVVDGQNFNLYGDGSGSVIIIEPTVSNVVLENIAESNNGFGTGLYAEE